jgi:outer membrane lipoprotein carrier protein
MFFYRLQPKPLLFVFLVVIFSLLISAPYAAKSEIGGASLLVDSFSCAKASPKISPDEALAIVEKVQAQYSSIGSMRGTFSQDSFVAALDEGELSSGSMVFLKPGKMRWSYRKPREQEVVIRDGEMWIYQPDKGQVLIDRVDNVLLSALPISFLMGLGNLTKDFKVLSACYGNRDGVLLTLEPRKSGAQDGKQRGDNLEGFTLLVDRSGGVPRGAKVNSVGGNRTVILFEGLEVNPAQGVVDRFQLEYPKGVDILDRR